MRKPDILILDNRFDPIRVVAAIEYKDDLLDDDGIAQAATVGALLGAKFCVSTDGDRSYWFLSDPDGVHRPILDETGQNYPVVFVSPDAKADAAAIEKSRDAIQELDRRLKGDRIVPDRTLDPTALARSVWQSIYIVGDNPTPERSLATFVEIFMFKFLSDLGVLDQDKDGRDVSFEAVLKKDDDRCLRYYYSTVRPYIKTDLFPPGADNTTILNGFAFDPKNKDHNHDFKKVLKKFKEFEEDPERGGKLLAIDKEFKSRLFEEFLKGSVGRKALGQFFTPRRLMGGIVDMADVEKLPDGAKVCDPACGVGGFPMETAARRARKAGKSDFRLVRERDAARIVPSIDYRGFDKGTTPTEPIAIILAKANFVIYQSDLLVRAPDATKALARVSNEVFRSWAGSSLGSLSEINADTYDLILSNPPYVAKGAASLREAAQRAGIGYTAGGAGVEAMFVEKMVRELKPRGRAFIIVPDGLLLRGQPRDKRLRGWVSERCFVDGIVSLPINTFFGTPKKTYVLALTRKEDVGVPQTYPVFAYLVTSIGETLDANRFHTAENDMPDMAWRFRRFLVDRARYEDDPACATDRLSDKAKCIPAADLFGSATWEIDRYWSKEERAKLGLYTEQTRLSEDEFMDELRAIRARLDKLIETGV